MYFYSFFFSLWMWLFNYLETLWFYFEEYSSCSSCVIDEFVLQHGVVEVAHGHFHQDFCIGTVLYTSTWVRFFRHLLSRT